MMLVALMLVACCPAMLVAMPQQYRYYQQVDQPASFRQPLVYNPQLASFGANPLFRTEFEPVGFYQARHSILPESDIPPAQPGTFKNPHVSYEIARLSLNRDDMNKIPVVANPSSLLPGNRYNSFPYQNEFAPSQFEVKQTGQQDIFSSVPDTLFSAQSVNSEPDQIQHSDDSPIRSSVAIPIRSSDTIPIRTASSSDGEAAASGSQSVGDLASSISQSVTGAIATASENIEQVSSSVANRVQDVVSSIAQSASESTASVSDDLETISSSISQGIQGAISSISSQNEPSVAEQQIPDSQINEAIDFVTRQAVIARDEAQSADHQILPIAVQPIVSESEPVAVDTLQDISAVQSVQPTSSGQPSAEASPLSKRKVPEGTQTGPLAGDIPVSSGNLPAAIDPNYVGSGKPAITAPVPSSSVPAAIDPNYIGSSKPSAIDSVSSNSLPAAIDPNYVGSGKPASIASVPSGSVPAAIDPEYVGNSKSDMTSIGDTSSDSLSAAAEPNSPDGASSAIPSSSNSLKDSHMPSTLYPKESIPLDEDPSKPSAVQQPSTKPDFIDDTQQSSVDTSSLESQSQSSIEISTDGQQEDSAEDTGKSVISQDSEKSDGNEENKEILLGDELDLFSLFRRRRPISIVDDLYIEETPKYSNAESPVDRDTISFVFSKRDVETPSEVMEQELVTEVVDETTTTDVPVTETPSAVQTTETTEEDSQSIQMGSQPTQEESQTEEEEQPTVLPEKVAENNFASAVPETDEQILTALLSDPEVQRTKYDFIASWNNEVYRRGISFLRIADVFPNTGYVYMPDIEAYTHFIQSTPLVQHYTREMITAWQNARNNIFAGNSAVPLGPVEITPEGDVNESSSGIADPSITETNLNTRIPDQLFSYQDYLQMFGSQVPIHFPQISGGAQSPFGGFSTIAQQQQYPLVQQSSLSDGSNPFFLRQNFPSPVPGGVSSNIVNTGRPGIPNSHFPKNPQPWSLPSTSHSSSKG